MNTPEPDDGRPEVVESIAALRQKLVGRGVVALVPTLGALHEGHLALVDRARELADTVVVSIFVNPLQFGAGEDLERYPRDLAGDLEMLSNHGVAYVFAPTVDEMYPDGGTETTVTGGEVATLFEGRSRPGHFDGVLTVVAKLLGIVRPDHVLFGQKDAQQVFLVQRMVADLNFATRVEVVETVRADDGLALSSRNKYLSAAERAIAPVLYRALATGAAAASGGPGAVRAAAQAVLDDADRDGTAGASPRVDYLALADARSYEPVLDDDLDFHGTAVLAIAARVGTTRLIDNVLVEFGMERHAADD